MVLGGGIITLLKKPGGIIPLSILSLSCFLSPQLQYCLSKKCTLCAANCILYSVHCILPKANF